MSARDPRWLAGTLGVQVNDTIEVVQRLRVTHVLDNGDVQLDGDLLHELRGLVSAIKIWPRPKVGETVSAERCEELTVGSVVRKEGGTELAVHTKIEDHYWGSFSSAGPLGSDREYQVLWIEPEPAHDG